MEIQDLKKKYVEVSIEKEIDFCFDHQFFNHSNIIVVPKVSIININAFLYGVLSKNTLENPYFIGNYNYLPISIVNKFLMNKVKTNVIFIEGESGVGKTHFLEYSILKCIMKNKKVYYFNVNSFLEYIKNSFKNSFSFHEFEKIDCVAIDDFQLLNKSSLSSFFHGVFSFIDYIINTNKILFITSDVSPYNLKEFPDRITTRLSGGIFTKIDPPTREAKKCYIHFFCERNKIPFIENDKVFDSIIEFSKNFRQLNALLTQYQLLYEENKRVDLNMFKYLVMPKKNFSPLSIKIEEMRKILREYYAYPELNFERKNKKKRTKIEALIDSVIIYCFLTFDDQVKKEFSKSQICQALDIPLRHAKYFYTKGEKEYEKYDDGFKNILLRVIK